MCSLPRKARKEEEIIRKFPFLWVIPSVYLLDRFFKILIVKRFLEGEGFPVIPGVFHVTRVNNTGAAFGILKGYGAVLLVLSAACILFLAVYLLRSIFLKPREASGATRLSFASQTAWSLVIAGALGNLYDRFRYGYVVDFLDFRIWPVFNVADASICAGVLLVTLSFLKRNKMSA